MALVVNELVNRTGCESILLEPIFIASLVATLFQVVAYISNCNATIIFALVFVFVEVGNDLATDVWYGILRKASNDLRNVLVEDGNRMNNDLAQPTNKGFTFLGCIDAEYWNVIRFLDGFRQLFKGLWLEGVG